MIHKMSPGDFSALVSESVSASEPAIEFKDSHTSNGSTSNSPLAGLDDDLGIDDIGIDDDLDIDDDLYNFEIPSNPVDSEHNEAVQSEIPESGNGSGVVQNQNFPDFLTYKFLDESSRIPDYQMDIKITGQKKETAEPESLFGAILQKFELSFMITEGCKSFCDLWNKNFIINQTDSEDVALERMLAMFYHIRCQTRHTVTQIRNTDNTGLVKKLEALGRVVNVRDIEILLSGDEEMPQNNDTISATSMEGHTESVESPEFTTTPELAETILLTGNSLASTETKSSEKKVTAATDSLKGTRLSKQKRLKLFVQHTFDVLLSSSAKSHILNIKSVKKSYDSLCSLFLAGKLEREEFVKFVLFLVKTREIVLDAELVERTKTFNSYFASLMCFSAKHKYVEDNYYDTVIMTGPQNGSISFVFMSYIAFNWRMLQHMANSKSDVNSARIGEKRAIIFRMDKTVELPKCNFRELKSPLTFMAEDFTKLAGAAIETFAQPVCNFNSDDLDFYIMKRNGLNVPAVYKALSSQEISSLGVVMSYTATYQRDIMELAASGAIAGIPDVKVWFLSNNNAFALYQMLTFCLSKEKNVNASLKYQQISEPRLVLSGSGVPSRGIMLAPAQFSDYCRLILEHISISSNTSISVDDGSLLITFSK